MTAKELIESGKLELYVTGSLPEEEHKEIQLLIDTNEDVKNEVEHIEASLLQLAESVAPPLPNSVWSSIFKKIKGVHTLQPKRNWTSMTGWAAAVACMLGVFWLLKKNNTLSDDLQKVTTQNVVLQEENTNAVVTVKNVTEILENITSEGYKKIRLPGNQAVSPDAYANVYFNSDEHIAYIDTKGLPKPPRGKVYQVWSLIMEPLTPTSIGLLISEDINTSDLGIYKFENIPNTQAFGITLEPEGGSETPTLSQLYTLGAIGQ